MYRDIEMSKMALVEALRFFTRKKESLYIWIVAKKSSYIVDLDLFKRAVE